MSSAALPKTHTCVCYICDEGYLFPTLLSAVQARRVVPRSIADVVVCYVGERTSKSELFEAIYKSHAVEFIHVPPTSLQNMHVMFGRLFFDSFLDSRYQHILYLDGDTQVAQDLSPLLELKLPDGMFCAARDPMTLAISWNNNTSNDQRNYFGAIGLLPSFSEAYFNSGVLRVDRESWAKISKRALELVKSRDRPFRFPDQDALNIVAADQCLTMSFKWNFPAFLLNVHLHKTVNPNIYHFMSNPRPWHGPFSPWGRHLHNNYSELLSYHPELTQHAPRLSMTRYLRYHLQQQYKKFAERPTWGGREVLEKIERIEAQAFI